MATELFLRGELDTTGHTVEMHRERSSFWLVIDGVVLPMVQPRLRKKRKA